MTRIEWYSINTSRCRVEPTKANLHKWGITQNPKCDCGHENRTMDYLLSQCPFCPSCNIIHLKIILQKLFPGPGTGVTRCDDDGLHKYMCDVIPSACLLQTGSFLFLYNGNAVSICDVIFTSKVYVMMLYCISHYSLELNEQGQVW